jgi:glycosyltransferase involved in cell wall biosynthesis
MTAFAPTVTVVVSSFNGAARLAETLDSIKAQRYPGDRLTLLVVDDGSSDATSEVAERSKVRVVRHERNRGLSAARNTGLAACETEIYAGFDDDCLADPDWLWNLTRPYEDPAVMGVGGRIVDSSSRSVVSRYLEAVGYGLPSPLEFGASTNPLARFATYARAMFEGRETAPAATYDVHEIMGGNSSFRADVLRAVSGWDEELSGAEDVDLCARLRAAFPDRTLVFVGTAAIAHEHNLSLRGLVSRPYRRGPVVYRYYRRNGVVPPVFPLPVASVGLLALGFRAAGLRRMLPLVPVVPQLTYPWWPLQASRRRSAHRLLFAYIQLLFEGATIAGLLRGALRRGR